MSGRLGRRGLALAVALILVYSGLSYYSNAYLGASDMGAALALAPLLIAGAVLLWRSRRPLVSSAIAFFAALLLIETWPLFERNFSKLYCLQECGLYGTLMLGFARTLRPGSVPLCTRLADKLHGPLTGAEIRYTRQVTSAWALFFGAITVATFTLFVLAPMRVWSLFVNFCTLPLAAVMFIAEYAVRCRVLPQADRGGILATLRVFLTSPR